jgi:prepilin-type N-terminal cleavage/methylation domain-containing protein
MRSNRGFTLFELLIVVALIGTLGAIAIPVLGESTNRNLVWTASEQIGSQIRQARLKAITRNQSYQVRFNCPAANQYRVLIVDGNINDVDRCTQFKPQDTGVYVMPANVTYNNTATLQVNGRGQYSIVGAGALPLTLNVRHRVGHQRNFTVSITGQITFANF